MENIKDTVIIGGGPAGLTAAIYAKRAGMDILVIEKGVVGGQINLTDKIANWPGTKEILGSDLAKLFKSHAESLSVEIRDATVSGISADGDIKYLDTNIGKIAAKTVIIASGASHLTLGCKGEAEHTGMGVCFCAVCDAAFFQDQPVAVIGGGNSALQEALFLTQFASKVYLIHRRNEYRADRILVDEINANPKIIPVLDSVADEITGEVFVESIIVLNVKTNEKTKIEVNGVFEFVGIKPNAEFLGDFVKQDANGWIETDENLMTSVPGVFAAGDVRKKSLRQVVTAAGDGAVAAMSAHKYLLSKQQINVPTSNR